MKIIIFFILFFVSINNCFAWYKLEKWSEIIAQKYKISKKNLDKPITRKEFVEILYKWYFFYKKEKWIKINYDEYKKFDNNKIFKDIDLNSDFWKKINYFSYLWAFSKREYFDPNGIVTQKDFFTIMKKLKILFWMQNCKYHKICEKEIDEKTPFLKATYIKYVSKILDKNLRKYYKNPKDYIKAWYKPYLSSNYNFPLRWQTLNWCYAFSVRNILKYKNWIWVYVDKAEKLIWKNKKDLWNYYYMDKYNKIVHIKSKKYYNIDTLINSLQAWEPVSITYLLKYYSYKEKKYKKVIHVVAAYSFDEKWIWVAETVTNKRILLTWEKVFNKNWEVGLRRIFKYYYNPKKNWTKKEIDFENKNNILYWEY